MRRLRRLPKFVRVAGLRHPITLVDDLTHEDYHEEEEDIMYHRAYGVFDPNAVVIMLDSAMGSERTKNTLVHEVLHASINATHIAMLPEDEEALVSRLAPVLLDFMRRNTGAIMYLQEN